MTTIAKPVTKIVELTLNGFHGYQSHNVRATFTPREAVEEVETPYGFSEGQEAGFYVSITESAARKFRCGCEGCTCGEGVATEFECDQIDFDTDSIELSGNYPQR